MTFGAPRVCIERIFFFCIMDDVFSFNDLRKPYKSEYLIFLFYINYLHYSIILNSKCDS